MRQRSHTESVHGLDTKHWLPTCLLLSAGGLVGSSFAVLLLLPIL